MKPQERSDYIPEGGVWTAKDLVRAEAIALGHVTADYEEACNLLEETCNLLDGARLTVAALIRALEEILNGQIGGNVDTRAKRFENARALLAELKK